MIDTFAAAPVGSFSLYGERERTEFAALLINHSLTRQDL